jgi:DNA-binding LacI/PurR family transcriptional regulator
MVASPVSANSHLLQHGHNRIGYITPQIYLANVAPKPAGHNRVFGEADIVP